MKITVKANDFCPDDCPNIDLKRGLFSDTFCCANRSYCLKIYSKVLKDKIAEIADDETAKKIVEEYETAQIPPLPEPPKSGSNAVKIVPLPYKGGNKNDG